jgi:hypothetical protein
MATCFAGGRHHELRLSVAGAAAVLCAVVLLGASCTSPSDAGIQPLSTRGVDGDSGTPLPGSPEVGIGSDPGQQEIVTGWRSAQEAFGSAVIAQDPTEPALAATTVEPQLSLTQALLDGMRAAGEGARGSYDLGQPRVVASTSNEATVRSCLHDAVIVFSGKTGKPVPGVEGEVANELVVSLMVETGGEWKLSDQTVREDQCSSP